MPKESKTKQTCAFCGETKSVDEFADRVHGKAPYCLECEQKYFERIEKECGLHLALYACCAAFNVPFLPLVITKDIENDGEKWIFYQNLLIEKGYFERDGKVLTFFDGGTNILRLFGRQFDDKTTAQYIEIETHRLANLQGTAEQRARWGTQDIVKNEPMTQEIYDILDGMYETRAAEYKGSTLSAQQNDVLIKVCKWNYIIDLLLQKGQFPYAEKLQKMVQSELAAECMRKQDEKPTEAFRIDAFTTALENAGLMENGTIKTYDEVMYAFYMWCKSQKYDYSEDVANQVVFKNINAMRANMDLPLLADLPEEYKIHDNYGECLPYETEREKAAKEFAGLSPIIPIKKNPENK